MILNTAKTQEIIPGVRKAAVLLLTLGEEDGQGIGLLARGAPRAPDADHGAGGLSGEEPGDDPLLEGFEGLFLFFFGFRRDWWPYHRQG